MAGIPRSVSNRVPVDDVLVYNEPENDKTKGAKIREIAATSEVYSVPRNNETLCVFPPF